MSIDEILEEMDELLDKASSVPFVSHKKVIDGERMRELIKEAKKIEFDCQRILNEAKINAEAIIRKAEERAAQIVSHEAIVVEAKKKAVDMLTKAQAAAKNLQQTAALNVAKMLNDTEAHYARNLQNIKMVKTKLGSTINTSAASIKTNPNDAIK